jgi:hypothetical protein
MAVLMIVLVLWAAPPVLVPLRVLVLVVRAPC